MIKFLILLTLVLMTVCKPEDLQSVEQEGQTEQDGNSNVVVRKARDAASGPPSPSRDCTYGNERDRCNDMCGHPGGTQGSICRVYDGSDPKYTSAKVEGSKDGKLVWCDCTVIQANMSDASISKYSCSNNPDPDKSSGCCDACMPKGKAFVCDRSDNADIKRWCVCDSSNPTDKGPAPGTCGVPELPPPTKAPPTKAPPSKKKNKGKKGSWRHQQFCKKCLRKCPEEMSGDI